MKDKFKKTGKEVGKITNNTDDSGIQTINMKLIVSLVVLAAFACAEDVIVDYVEHSAYGYLENVAVPAAERIRKAEEEYLSVSGRIIGGVPAGLGQYPYQAGLISDIIGITGRGVCGGALISRDRVLTAAHCWFDGRNQAWRLTVVLGSTLLFSGGLRSQTSVVVMHANWNPSLARNDVAVVYLPNQVAVTSNISPIALPSGPVAEETFEGNPAIIAGFGLTSQGGSITDGQNLNHIRLQVISNRICSFSFPLIIQASNICTSGVGNVGPCGGDSGSALTVTRNNTVVAIGIASFVSAAGCDRGLPAAYARVTSFLAFIQQHL